MADLQSCYFCGAGPNEALREYGVVPEALGPTDETQRSVVLCPDCREKLTAVMRAAVEASDADVGGAAPSPSSTAGDDDIVDATPDGHGTDAAGGAPEEPAGDDDRVGTPEPPAREDDADAAGSEESRDVESGEGEAPTSDGVDADADTDEVSADANETSADAGGERNRERADDDDIARTQGSGVSFGTATAGDEDVEGSDAAEETPPQRETGAASVDSEAGMDPGTDAGSAAYRQVIRLLQNREFPVRRDEIAEVAASAYDLSAAETEAAIDAVVRKGLLVEDEGVLRRP